MTTLKIKMVGNEQVFFGFGFDVELADLVGTDKQIAYANDIRANLLRTAAKHLDGIAKKLDAQIAFGAVRNNANDMVVAAERLAKMQAAVDKGIPAAQQALILRVFEVTSAKWWIKTKPSSLPQAIKAL